MMRSALLLVVTGMLMWSTAASGDELCEAPSPDSVHYFDSGVDESQLTVENAKNALDILAAQLPAQLQYECVASGVCENKLLIMWDHARRTIEGTRLRLDALFAKARFEAARNVEQPQQVIVDDLTKQFERRLALFCEFMATNYSAK